jgi:hypothetical protein
MTQPNDFQPTTSANYGSLSTWSQKTQGDWQSGISAGFAGPLNGIGGFFTMIVSTISSIVGAIAGVFLGGIGIIGGIVTGIIGAVASFFGALFGGFTGTTAPNNQASAFDVHLGADGLRKTVGELQSDVQSMKFDQLPPGGGVYVDNAVNPSDADWPNFDMFGSGTVKIISNRGFVWAKSGKVSRSRMGIYEQVTASDLQVSGQIFRSLPQAGACNRVLGRVGHSGDTRVYAGVYNNKVELGCYVDGVKHVFETALGAPSSSSLWELQCGTEDDDYNILVFQNRSATAIIDYHDTDHVSQLGSAFRAGGLEMISGPGAASETAPGDIMQFTLRDIAPPPILGTGLRVRSLSSTTYPIPGALISSISNGFFDSIDYMSDDVDWDPSLTQATIKTEGHYAIKFAIPFNVWKSSVTVYPSYYQNSAVGGSESPFGSAGTDSQTKGIFGSFDTYCHVGDTILPAMGIATSGAISIIGDGTGQFAWMTITKVG